VAGIVGAGGNVGAVLASFFFKGAMPWTQALLCLGAIVVAISVFPLMVRFSEAEEHSAEREIAARLAGEMAVAGAMGD
jgi:NNP family nitrate/nitrite transporter-like MFS transporter